MTQYRSNSRRLSLLLLLLVAPVTAFCREPCVKRRLDPKPQRLLSAGALGRQGIQTASLVGSTSLARRASSESTDANDRTRSTSGDEQLATTASNDRRLQKAYQVGTYAFGIAAPLIAFMPDRTMTTLLATKFGGAAGFGMAAGLCMILQGATKHQRLQSDTYQRLNLGLLAFCGVGLFAFPSEAGFLEVPKVALGASCALQILRLYGAILAYAGWKTGVGSAVSLLKTLGQGTKTTLHGLKVKNSKKALTYRNCLVLVCMGIVSSFMEGLFHMRYRLEFTRTWFEISLQWSAVSRLTMVATMIYSLKDAAERDRLTGTTFILLNLMVGCWALLVGLGQAIYPLGFAAYRGVEMFSFSLPFFIKALKSQKEKQAQSLASA